MSANLRIKDLKMYGPKLTRLMGNATRAELSPSGGSLRRSEWLRNSKPSRLSFNAGCMIAWPRSVHGSGKVVLGYYQYHAVPGNTTQLRIFKLRVCRLWQSVLVRRSQRAKMRWERFTPVLNRWMIASVPLAHTLTTEASRCKSQTRLGWRPVGRRQTHRREWAGVRLARPTALSYAAKGVIRGNARLGRLAHEVTLMSRTKNVIPVQVLACAVGCVLSAAAAASAAENDTIVLGASVSLTGKYSTNGKDTKDGYDLAVKRINESGGVKVGGKPYQLKVVYYDDESTSARGAQLVERLI